MPSPLPTHPPPRARTTITATTVPVAPRRPARPLGGVERQCTPHTGEPAPEQDTTPCPYQRRRCARSSRVEAPLFDRHRLREAMVWIDEPSYYDPPGALLVSLISVSGARGSARKLPYLAVRRIPRLRAGCPEGTRVSPEGDDDKWARAHWPAARGHSRRLNTPRRV